MTKAAGVKLGLRGDVGKELAIGEPALGEYAGGECALGESAGG